ncbi:MAG: hypothetical protein R6V00_04490 [Candidatus Aminicenantes bacterium]
MKKMKPLNLNLAENPLRNKRLFHTIFFFLCGLSVVLLVISLVTFYQYRTKNQNIKKAIVKIEDRINHTQREGKRYFAQIDTLSNENLAQVNFINHLISQKSFSWTGLFTALEKSLPDKCYIVSISPMQKEDTPTEIKLEIASAGLDPFFKFINNLYSMDFNNFRLIREGRDETGHLISEISLSYDENY